MGCTSVSKLVLLAACMLLSWPCEALEKRAKYETSAKRDPAKLNVHLVPHTHDDSGWLKTFDQYYWGTRQDIQTAAVQHVLSTVIQALKDNPNRKFSYAEMSFFTEWWSHQPEAIRADVKQLVASGQLDFINGGFVQHDEATAHYCAMIDQTSRGHRFLNATFGFRPRIAWQIDPFGHSATQAALLSAAAGYEALFFGRADYQDMQIRSAQRQLELLWRPSQSWGRWGQIFTHNYPTGNYGPPPGFDFNWGTSWDAPIVDNPNSPEYNVPTRVDEFVAQASAWGRLLQGNDVLMMMGSDFQHANAHATFINLDRLIHHVNADGRVNVFYSTPADYIAAKAAYGNETTWPLKTDDFFPYADCAHCYWTGYFTSRPTSKGYIRQATAYLAAARQLQALTPTTRAAATGQQQHASPDAQVEAPPQLDRLEFAVSLAQHHDAITGTEKQAVANDYARYLFLGMQQASQVVNAAVEQLLLKQDAPAHSATASSSSSSCVSSVYSWLTKAPGTAARLLGRLLRSLPGLCNSIITTAYCLMHGHEDGAAMAGSSSCHPSIAAAGAAAGGAAATDSPRKAGEGQQVQLVLSQCPLLNVSICARTVSFTDKAAASQLTSMDADSSGLLVAVYNSLAWPRSELVRVPVAAPAQGTCYAVEDAEGVAVPSELVLVSPETQQLQAALVLAGLASAREAATHELVFAADPPPLGYAAYAVLQPNISCGRCSSGMDSQSESNTFSNQDLDSHQQQHQQQQQFSTGKVNVTLNLLTGRLSELSAADGSWSLAFTQELMWYQSSRGEEPPSDSLEEHSSSSAASGNSNAFSAASRFMEHDSTRRRMGGGGCSSRDGRLRGASQSSGAYIFRPAGDRPGAIRLVPAEQPLHTTVVSGALLTEIRQVWSGWAQLTTRLRAGAAWIDQEWTVGPIPACDGVGREVIVRTSTNLTTGGVLYTDSNGREILRRELNQRPTWALDLHEPVAGNYYPITAAAAITDGCLTLGLATDRSQGAASLGEGQLEVMLHRVTTVDDARGVGEPLRETLCGCTGCSCAAGGLPARGRHILVVGAAVGAARALRAASQQLNDPLLLLFGQLPEPPVAPSTATAASTSSDNKHSGSNSGSGSSHTQEAAHAAVASTSGIIPALELRGRWSGLAGGDVAAAGLPANVHLLTLMRADEADSGRLILRLAHTFQVGEDTELSQPARVDLVQLLGLPVARVAELSLTAAQYKTNISLPHDWPEGESLGAAATTAAAGAAGAQGGASKQGQGDSPHPHSSSSGSAASPTAAHKGRWGDVYALSQAAVGRCHLARAILAGQSAAPAAPAANAPDTAGSLRAASHWQLQSQDAAVLRPNRRHLQQRQQQPQELQHAKSADGALHSAADADDEQQVYNIWDHDGGDAGSVVELFPMEIRTWEVTLG